MRVMGDKPEPAAKVAGASLRFQGSKVPGCQLSETRTPESTFGTLDLWNLEPQDYLLNEEIDRRDRPLP